MKINLKEISIILFNEAARCTMVGFAAYGALHVLDKDIPLTYVFLLAGLESAQRISRSVLRERDFS